MNALPRNDLPADALLAKDRFWARVSRVKQRPRGRPTTAAEIRRLIERMAAGNTLWRAPTIHYEFKGDVQELYEYPGSANERILMGKRTAVVTGAAGQDGSIISELLTDQDYQVFAMIRRNSQGSLGCLAPLEKRENLVFLEGDLLDLTSIQSFCRKAKPDLFINCAVQSHVGSSFEQPIYTTQATGLGVLNCLEAIRYSGVFSRFVQLSTSEMFGGVSNEPATEQTAFVPRSPYGCAKLYGYWITITYRNAYKMHASNAMTDSAQCYDRTFLQSDNGDVGYLSDESCNDFGGILRREWTYPQCT